MKRGLSIFAATAAAVMLSAGIACADPVPKVGNTCRGSGDSSAASAGSQAFDPQGDVLLCPFGESIAVWTHVDGVQRPAESWYTYGPAATLTANDVTPGSHWIGYGGNDCSVIQTSTAGGSPVVKQIQAGAPYTDFYVLPDLASLKFVGACDWRTAGNSPYGP
jgi:hypothetical protein